MVKSFCVVVESMVGEMTDVSVMMVHQTHGHIIQPRRLEGKFDNLPPTYRNAGKYVG